MELTAPKGMNLGIRATDSDIVIIFGAYRRKVLDEIGLFDEELTRNQDDELNLRVLNVNKKILLTPKVKSTYYARASFQKLWKQYFQYGFWKVSVIQKHKKPAAIRHLIPLLFVLYLIIGGGLSIFFKPIRIIFLFVLGLYILLDIYYAVKLSLGKRLNMYCIL